MSTQNGIPNENLKALDLSGLKAALGLIIEQGCEVLREVSQKPLEKGTEIVQKVSENGKIIVDKGVETVKKNPVASLLVALGLGFLVVLIFKKKK
ncbi:hypothetical protein LPY66_08435 [Dehalobacter sp. DCM]|uniref:hypothetical protein n=1 Tax=Dehalobacter sp. DCM TaxID=2907827 RepID=UPI003081A3AF|nr:hypothetical protein LPY66_08435 [Dehalobacter sp. DCM]